MSEHKTILVTGAASGIGRATAELFAERGWRVAATDVNAGLLDALALPGEGHWRAALDVADRASVEGALAAFKAETGGRLDCLFSNAGIIQQGPFTDMAWDRLRALVEVNLLGSISLIHAAWPLLAATPGSLYLQTASASAIFGAAGLAVYSATKHGVRGLTEALSVELSTHGIRVADLLPGIIDTGMLPPEMKARMPGDGPWRVLPPRPVAEAAWAACHGDKLHYYVPVELAAHDLAITRDPESERDAQIARRSA